MAAGGVELALPAVELLGSMGFVRVLEADRDAARVRAEFDALPRFCHTDGTIVQGGFVTAWLDFAMAQAALLRTGHEAGIASLEIKVSFLQRMGPGPGTVEARVVRRGKRVAFMEAELFDSEGRMTARASSTGLMTELIR
jgi:uncharacterized protein (TIGR00369 family)